MAVERTLSIIKPDATEKNVTGAIIKKFEMQACVSSLKSVFT